MRPVKKTTQWRYHKQLLENYYIRKVKIKGENLNLYEVTDPNEYKELEDNITKALEECLLIIGDPKRSIVPERSVTKTERTTKRKRAS